MMQQIARLGWQAQALAALLCLAVPAVAQPPDDQPLPEPVAAGPELFDSDVRCSLGATALFGLSAGGVPRPLPALAALRAGEEKVCWTLVDTAQVRPFAEAWRGWVTDSKPILDDPQEVEAYARTLILAHWTETAALEKAARRDLTYVQLFREPEKYRGEIVRVSGRMKRIRRYDDPPEIARRAGVRYLYEGWMFNADFGSNPVCCVFTDLPEGLRATEKMEERVEFAGYLFKRYRYKAGDTPKPNQWREAPLIVGRVVAVLPRDVEHPTDWSWVMPAFLTLVGGSVAAVVFLTVWLRRGDDRVRRRLAALAPRPFVLENEPESGPATENRSSDIE
jgi:hypothetical protein